MESNGIGTNIKKGAAVLLLPTSNNQKPTNYDAKSLVPLKGIEPLLPCELPLGVLTDRRKRQKNREQQTCYCEGLFKRRR